jgi:hypothetical protein
VPFWSTETATSGLHLRCDPLASDATHRTFGGNLLNNQERNTQMTKAHKIDTPEGLALVKQIHAAKEKYNQYSKALTESYEADMEKAEAIYKSSLSSLLQSLAALLGLKEGILGDIGCHSLMLGGCSCGAEHGGLSTLLEKLATGAKGH